MQPKNDCFAHGDVGYVVLTQGQVALVDVDDLELIAPYRWHAAWMPDVRSFYAFHTLPRPATSGLRMHRLILGLGFGDKRQGDHIHHDTLDNRRSQLRITDNQGNVRNPRLPERGYSRRNDCNRWEASITVDGKGVYLGLYADERAASEMYEEAYWALKEEYE